MLRNDTEKDNRVEFVGMEKNLNVDTFLIDITMISFLLKLRYGIVIMKNITKATRTVAYIIHDRFYTRIHLL